MEQMNEYMMIIEPRKQLGAEWARNQAASHTESKTIMHESSPSLPSEDNDHVQWRPLSCMNKKFNFCPVPKLSNFAEYSRITFMFRFVEFQDCLQLPITIV